MREIKFRAWDTVKKEMVKNNEIDVSEDAHGYYSTTLKLNLDGVLLGFSDDDGGKSGLWEHSVGIEKDRIILMQFTGLKDKNGREIYEGDVVKSIYDSRHLKLFKASVDDYKEEIYVVEHDECNPCFVLVSPKNRDRREYDFIMCGMRTNEVTGNIHENTELLTALERQMD